MHIENNDVCMGPRIRAFQNQRYRVAFSRARTSEDRSVPLKEAISVCDRRSRLIDDKVPEVQPLRRIQLPAKQTHKSLKIPSLNQIAFAVDLRERVGPSLELVSSGAIEFSECSYEHYPERIIGHHFHSEGCRRDRIRLRDLLTELTRDPFRHAN